MSRLRNQADLFTSTGPSPSLSMSLVDAHVKLEGRMAARVFLV